MARLGFVGRIIGIVLLLLLALFAMNTLRLLLIVENRQPDEARFPLPGQAAAIVELLDILPADQRSQLLQAVGHEKFQVSLIDKLPPPKPGEDRLPGIEWLVAQYLDRAPDREVRVMAAHLEHRANSVRMRSAERIDAVRRASETPCAASARAASRHKRRYSYSSPSCRRGYSASQRDSPFL